MKPSTLSTFERNHFWRENYEKMTQLHWDAGFDFVSNLKKIIIFFLISFWEISFKNRKIDEISRDPFVSFEENKDSDHEK